MIANLIPILIVCIIIAIGLAVKPDAMINVFNIFAKIMVAFITFFLACAIIDELTGFVIIPGMAPLSDGFLILGDIAIILAGAYPLVYFLTKFGKKPLMKVGSLLGINDVSAAGLIATLANDIPMMGMVKDMDDKGKVINFAFMVCAAFTFGDHLGFCAGVAKHMIGPMIAGKIAGGILGIIGAIIVWNFVEKRDETVSDEISA
jgi:ethanolamine transporter